MKKSKYTSAVENLKTSENFVEDTLEFLENKKVKKYKKIEILNIFKPKNFRRLAISFTSFLIVGVLITVSIILNPLNNRKNYYNSNNNDLLKQKPSVNKDYYGYKTTENTTLDELIQQSGTNTDTADFYNEYSSIKENIFIKTIEEKLSTFSIDVDTASYSILRSYINNGKLPLKNTIRIEEMLNYFKYDYAKPKDGNAFSVTSEIGNCPWNSEHKIALIGIAGAELEVDKLPPSNLVFLIDTSGSMSAENKLPLLKQAYLMLIEKLSEKDIVSIVRYGSNASVVISGIKGNEKKKITDAINSLDSKGSTAGGAGIETAYGLAEDYFIKNGNNRVILATDGDFNVGLSNIEELKELIENKRKSGVFFSVLGFGYGNYKDNKLEVLADKGNGNYAYIDSINEAKRVLFDQFAGTVFTVAKDVKIQVEFDSNIVSSYRLIGYENRALNNEDFNNDNVDAGEIGSGHTVTAIYELVMNSDISESTDKAPFVVRIRYKEPKEGESKLIESEGKIATENSMNFKFATAVAEVGLILLDSEFKCNADLNNALMSAEGSIGNDTEGYRKEFVDLIVKLINIKNNVSG